MHAVAVHAVAAIAPAPPRSSTGSASAASAASAAATQLTASVEDEQTKQAKLAALEAELAAKRARLEAEQAELADERARQAREAEHALAELADKQARQAREAEQAKHAEHAERDKLAAERAQLQAERAQLAHNPVENLLDKITEGECYQAHSVSEASTRISSTGTSSSTSSTSTTRCRRSGDERGFERGWYLEKFFTPYKDDSESIEMSKLFNPGTTTGASAKIITSGTAKEMHVEIDRASVEAAPNLYKGKLDQMLLHPEQADKTERVQSQCMIRAFREIKDNLINQGINTDILGHAHAGTVLGESGFILSPMGELACRYGQPIPPTPRVLTSALTMC